MKNLINKLRCLLNGGHVWFTDGEGGDAWECACCRAKDHSDQY